MILFGILYSLAGTVLVLVLVVAAVLQFIFVLLGSAPNARLLAIIAKQAK